MKTVCIVGLAPSTRAWFMDEPEGTEIWSLNMGHAYFNEEQMARFTQWFQIHPRIEMEPRQSEVTGHMDFLKAGSIPVYMEEVHEDFPSSMRYPYEEVCATIGGNYMTSAPAFMLALAIHQGYELIKIFGIDLDCDKEWAYEKACFEHLLGIAMGKGIKVFIPEGCPLLKGDLYGKTVDIPSSVLVEEFRKLKKYEVEIVAEINMNEGKIALAAELENKELERQFLEAAANLVGQLNMNQGALNVLEKMVEWAFKGVDRLGSARTGNMISLDGSRLDWFKGGEVSLPEHVVSQETDLKYPQVMGGGRHG